MANINGTAASETLTGTDGYDVINQRTQPVSGSDSVFAMGGDDVIFSGTGANDTSQVLSVDAGTGNDEIRYANDAQNGFSHVSLLGGDGDDIFGISSVALTGTPTGTMSIDGGAGRDILSLDVNSLKLLPVMTLTGFESLSLPGSINSVSVTADQVRGFSGTITDFASMFAGATIQVTGGGSMDFSGTDLPQLTNYLSLNFGSDPINIIGSSDKDSITSSGSDSVIHGWHGDDKISVASVTSTPLSNVQVYGDDGYDTISFSGVNSLIDGGTGINSLNAFTYGDNSTVFLDNAASATGTTLPGDVQVHNIQQVSLSVVGNDNEVFAGATGSSITLTGTNNIAHGGAGSDTLNASEMVITPGGTDLTSGTGHATIDYSSATGPIYMGSGYSGSYRTVFYKEVSAWIGGSPNMPPSNGPSVHMQGNADVFGGSYDDVLVGNVYSPPPSPFVFNPTNFTVNLHGGAGNDSLTPGAGASTLDGGTGIDTLTFASLDASSGGAVVDLGITGPQVTGFGTLTLFNIENVTGSDGSDHIRGDNGPNVLIGGLGDDTLYGMGGNDVLIDSAGSNALDGGDGIDTLALQDASGHFRVNVHDGGGTVTGANVNDQLFSVETIKFVDTSLTSDADSTAASLYRLYATAFGRPADQGGLDTYATLIASGTSLATVADIFVNSREFSQQFSGLSNEQFVDKLYEVAFHRSPDESGRAYYDAALNNGTLTRADMVVSFSESAEQRADTAGAVAQGIWAADRNASAITLLYDAGLSRSPDQAGLTGYGIELENSVSLDTIANQIANSDEFLKLHSVSDSTFIDQLYQSALHRAPDVGGKAAYMAELANGYTRGDVLEQVALSDEHQSLLLQHRVDFSFL